MPIQLSEIFQVLNFAAEQHKYQRRGGYAPLPYINHLLKVTDALVNIGKETDRDLVFAALLHDIIEDTDVTYENLSGRFGEKVAGIVRELTDDMSLPYQKRKQRQIDSAPTLSTPAKKIRIADKASNLQDIFTYPLDWSQSKKEAYLENAIRVVDQIRGTHTELENWFDQVVIFAREQLQP